MKPVTFSELAELVFLKFLSPTHFSYFPELRCFILSLICNVFLLRFSELPGKEQGKSKKLPYPCNYNAKTIFSLYFFQNYEPHIVSQGKAKNKSYCRMITRHSMMKQRQPCAGKHPLTGLLPVTTTIHKCPWRWSYKMEATTYSRECDTDILQFEFIFMSLYYFEIKKFNYKISKYTSACLL